MNRIFGYGNKKSSDQLLLESSKAMDQAQDGLNKRLAHLETQISQVNVQLQALQRKIAGTKSPLAQKPLKQRALKLLNKRKQLEAMQEQLDSQSWSMNQAQMTTENLKNTMVTVSALKQTSKVLKQQYGKIDVDKLQDMQDEMAELIEQGEELQQVLATNYNDIDEISESELDAELEALEDGGLDFTLDESNDVELPSYLGGMAPAFVDEPAEVEHSAKLETTN
ncbi:HBL383Cp [Eremothecium sinecaudum]|uniref:HBL383Cp n=1 Tax=Eremothecium sinecaudum TaxID=45286 RepID=A0A109UVZ0_9SACH|nr:HBL383Cp [Eremothecium sinecaudum]AMD18519.1 HBL383Cp [Eremothecium sinecaudum]